MSLKLVFGQVITRRRKSNTDISDIFVTQVEYISLRILACIALLAFAYFSYANISLLALFTDEVYFAAPAADMVRDIPYFQHLAFAGTNHLNGPPAVGQYVYSFPLTYYFVAIFSLLEPSVAVIRFALSVIHLAFLFSSYLLARKLFGETTGVLAMVLLAVQPSLYFIIRDSPDTMFQVLLGNLGFAALISSVRSRRLRLAVAGGFMLGAAINVKAGYVLVAAVIFAAFGCLLCRVGAKGVATSLITAGVGVSVGLAELLVANAYEPLLHSGSQFLSTVGAPIASLQKLEVLFRGFIELTSGAYFRASETVFFDALTPALLALCWVVACFFGASPVRMLGVMSALVLVGLFIIPAHIEPRILLYVCPWLYMILAHFFVEIYEHSNSSRWMRRVVLGVVFLVIGLNMHNNFRYLETIRAGGSAAWHDERLAQLHDFLLAAPVQRTALLDWGLNDTLRVLRKDSREIVDNFQAAKRLSTLVADYEQTYFVSLPALETKYSVELEFSEQVRAIGAEVVVVFQQHDGPDVLARVYELRTRE